MMPRAVPVVTDDLVSEMWNHIFCCYLMGGIVVLVSLFMIACPLVTAAVNTVALGGALLVVGFAQLFFAVHSQPGSLLLKIMRSALFAAAGLWLECFSHAEVDTVSMLLMAMLLAGAGAEAIAALAMHPQNGWKWFLSDAAVSFLIAILIISGWPATALRGIGILVGVSVLMSGISRVMIAYIMQSRVFPVERIPVERVSTRSALSRRAA
jgi:uncharacterized membrane protein HdeD (DUF308 family)